MSVLEGFTPLDMEGLRETLESEGEVTISSEGTPEDTREALRNRLTDTLRALTDTSEEA